MREKKRRMPPRLLASLVFVALTGLAASCGEEQSSGGGAAAPNRESESTQAPAKAPAPAEETTAKPKEEPKPEERAAQEEPKPEERTAQEKETPSATAALAAVVTAPDEAEAQSSEEQQYPDGQYSEEQYAEAEQSSEEQYAEESAEEEPAAEEPAEEEPAAEEDQGSEEQYAEAESSSEEEYAEEDQGSEEQYEEELAAAPSDPTMYLSVPKLGIAGALVVDGEAGLEMGTMHLPGTGFPWQEGANTYIAGHRVGFPGTGSDRIFYNLPAMAQGDEVTLEDANGEVYSYQVSEVFAVTPSDTWVVQPTGSDTVTLQVCTENPEDWWTIGPSLMESGPESGRLIVRANRVA